MSEVKAYTVEHPEGGPGQRVVGFVTEGGSLDAHFACWPDGTTDPEAEVLLTITTEDPLQHMYVRFTPAEFLEWLRALSGQAAPAPMEA